MKPSKSLEIYVGRQANGYVYELHPASERRVREMHPQANMVPSVVIGSGTQQSFEQERGPIFEHVAMLLTGLDLPQLAELGGVRVYDPLAEKEVWVDDFSASRAQ